MSSSKVRLASAAFLGTIASFAGLTPTWAQSASQSIDEALQNISTLVRVGKVGYATFWDGNKFIQCRRIPERQMRCESAGSTMQPSLKSVLTGERATRLTALGWSIDPSFGNYVRIFSGDIPTERIAAEIQRALIDGYDAKIDDLRLSTVWAIDVPCPPRAGFSQNLAGSVNDAPSMRKVVVTTCEFTLLSSGDATTTDQSLDELRMIYGTRVRAEIQRLRLNHRRAVWVVFDAGIGYVQCMPDKQEAAIYCEAQSAESWAALATVLTPPRVSILRKAGFAEPGRTPNYAKKYPLAAQADGAIADEIISLLHTVYGYTGKIALKMKTES